MLYINNLSNRRIKFTNLERLFAVMTSQFSLNGDVELSLINNKEMQELNKKYAQNDYPTDVLSWAFQEVSTKFEHELFGEMFISVEMAISQASSKGHSLQAEICYLFVHGMLHLLGYDHQTPLETKKMDDLTLSILGSFKNKT